jgi:hypothetical protein
MRRRVPLRLLALLMSTAAAAAAVGCGSTATRPRTPARRPLTTSTGASARSAAAPAAKLAQAQRSHEYPGPVPHQTVAGGWRTAVQAVDVFASTYINWTAATVSGKLSALADVSIGQARSAMALAAAGAGHDYELRRGGIANSGVVEAIAPVSGRQDQYAVVTRELTTATNTGAYQGLAPSWHVSLATVARVQGGLWVLSGWQPEN